jgi:hypothetical protein
VKPCFMSGASVKTYGVGMRNTSYAQRPTLE